MKFYQYKLSNNLRVILAPMQDTQTATVMLMTGTGSRYETKENNGISHFLEHMFFKGTQKRPTTLAIAEELDSVGGEFNAYTSKDHTMYYAKVDAKHLPIALDIVSDMLLHSKFDPEEIEREKGTIIQELNMYEDMPARMVGSHFEKLLYGDTPLGWEIIGTKDTINGFQRKDFINYLKSQYVAGNMALVVAGNFNVAKTKKIIESQYSGFPQGKWKEKKKAVDKQLHSQLFIKDKKTDQTHLVIGVRTFDMFHPDRHALAILSNILGGNMSSRLFIEVRERRGLAYHVHSFVEGFHDAGYLATQSGVEHKNLSETIKVILGEYRKITQEKVGPKELAKAKEYLKAQLVMSLESSDEVASFLVSQEIMRKEIKLPKEIAKKIDAVTADDIQRVAKNIFQNKKLNLAVIGPNIKKASLEKIFQL